MQKITTIGSWFFNQLFPISCLLCGTYGSDICTSCSSTFTWPKYQKRKWVTSFWNYRDPNVEIVLRHIKSMPNNRIARYCAQLFSERILNRPRNPDLWVIIPIPIARTRFRQRGFNQSELIARAMSHRFTIQLLTSVLVKTHHTKKQGTTRSREERAQNITGSFSVDHQHLIQGKHIILIDDIVTTGSTLLEARHALIKAGAHRVIAWTLAN